MEPLNELDELIAAVLEGTIIDSQRARLSELLVDEQARSHYLDVMTMHALLRHTLEGTAGEKAGALDVLAHIADYERSVGVAMPKKNGNGKQGNGQGGKGWKIGSHPGLLAACVLLGAGVILLLSLLLTSGEPAPPQPVATLTLSRYASWEDDQGRLRRFHDGQKLLPQTLNLVDGLATVTFQNGAVVVLDARWHPVKYELQSPSESFLRLGRITANVESQSAKGFVVGVPGERRVVDLGTEFGIEVEANGMTQVHVLQGKVELRSSNQSATEEPRTLEVGQAVQFSPQESIAEIEADSDGFLTSSRLALMLEPAPAPKDEAPKKDSSTTIPLDTPPKLPVANGETLAHYRFDAADDASTTLVDSGPGKRDGVIQGAVWVQGRRSGLKALRFAGGSDCVKVQVPGEFKSLTLAAWVRVDALNQELTSLLDADGWEPGDVHWQLDRLGRIEFSVHYAIGALNDYYSPPVEALKNPSAWTHLATVHDAKSGLVQFFVNGEVVGALRIRADVTMHFDSARIGNWRSGSGAEQGRGFRGDISDLVVLSRALSAEEVKRLYEESK